MNLNRFKLTALVAVCAATSGASAGLVDLYHVASISGSASFPGGYYDSYSSSLTNYESLEQQVAWAQHALGRSELLTTWLFNWPDSTWEAINVFGSSTAGYDMPGGQANAEAHFDMSFITNAPWVFSGSTFKDAAITLLNADNQIVFSLSSGDRVNTLVNAGRYRVLADTVGTTSYSPSGFDHAGGDFYLTIPSPGPLSLALLGIGVLCSRRRRSAQ
jgi:hypothetical protein